MSQNLQNRIPVLNFTNSTLWGGVEGHVCGLLVKRERFQIVHSHMFWSSLFASPIAWACRVPVILETLHGTEAWRKGWKASNRIDRAVNQFVSKHIAVCKSDARFLSKKKRVPARKIEIIHNGIDARRVAISREPRQATR